MDSSTETKWLHAQVLCHNTVNLSQAIEILNQLPQLFVHYLQAQQLIQVTAHLPSYLDFLHHHVGPMASVALLSVLRGAHLLPSPFRKTLRHPCIGPPVRVLCRSLCAGCVGSCSSLPPTETPLPLGPARSLPLPRPLSHFSFSGYYHYDEFKRKRKFFIYSKKLFGST